MQEAPSISGSESLEVDLKSWEGANWYFARKRSQSLSPDLLLSTCQAYFIFNKASNTHISHALSLVFHPHLVLKKPDK